MSVRAELTPYGFKFGAATVHRMCSDDRKGWAVISVETPRQNLQIYVTRTGKVRIHDKESKEWTP